MAKGRTINPANRVLNDEIIRFRGVIIGKNEQATDRAYVQASDNLESFRLREMTPRAGQVRKTEYDSGIIGAEKTLSYITIVEGSNVYVSDIRDGLAPVDDIDFIRPIIVTKLVEVIASDKFSNYHGSVFSRKRAIWGGMDQGKGSLYRGDFTEMTLNLDFQDNVFRPRVGQDRVEDGSAGITGAERTLSGITVVSGSNVFFGETLPSLSI